MRKIAASLLLLAMGCASRARREPPPRTTGASPFAYEHYLRAEMESAKGRPAAAVEELRRALASDPSSAPLRLRLARELERLGRLEEAADEARRASQADPDDPRPHVLLGAIAWRRGDGDAAIAALRKALDREPPFEPAYERLAEVVLASRGGAAQDVVLREWTERMPESAEAWCRLGRAAADRGDAGPAADAYARCSEIEPHRTAARLRMAELLDAAGETEVAVGTLEEALAAGGDRLTVLEALVPLLARIGRREKAAALLESMDALEGGESPITVGYLFLAAGQPIRAEKLGREALKRPPVSPRAALLVADALAARGRRTDALAVLERVGPGSAREVEARIRIVGLLREEGRVDEALAQAERLAADHPNLAAPHELAATCLTRTGDLNGALAEVREALRMDPGRPSSLSLLGVLQAETGGPLGEAESLARRALAARPGSGQVLHDLGWIVFKSGRLKEARLFLEKAARVEPGSQTIRRHLEQLRSRAKAPLRRGR